MSARGQGSDRVEYVDPGRRYVSTAVLAGLIVVGFLVDLAVVGGGGAHAIAWGIAFVLVVGIDALAVHATRLFRSVVVTPEELRVGESRVARAEILGYQTDAAPGAPVLGLRGMGLPRGVPGLALHLKDGRTVLVPARHPDQLVVALQTQLHVADVRPADEADAEAIADIAERSITLYRVAGMDIPESYTNAIGMSDALVVLVSGRPPEGFIRLAEVDGAVNIALMAVVPKRMKAGLGSSLLDAACGWSVAHGYRVMTVTTYADIDWNARFFASRGFVPVTELGPEMAELRDWERAVGLDALGERLVMRRALES